jgi:hypothetical protein
MGVLILLTIVLPTAESVNVIAETQSSRYIPHHGNGLNFKDPSILQVGNDSNRNDDKLKALSINFKSMEKVPYNDFTSLGSTKLIADDSRPAGVSGVGVTVGALAIIGSAAGFIKFTLSEPIEQENELQLARDKAYSLHV